MATGQALPCSSGSSELWFASKVFAGEEVVLKKVSAGKEAAFERERAVLKVCVSGLQLLLPLLRAVGRHGADCFLMVLVTVVVGGGGVDVVVVYVVSRDVCGQLHVSSSR